MNQSVVESPLGAILDFVNVLESLKVPYLIGGSFASSVRGEFRTTQDIDFLCKLREEHLTGFFSGLGTAFIVDEIAVRSAVRERRCFNIIHEASLMKLDIFTRVEAFQEEQLRRAAAVTLPGTERSVRVASAEDIILAKLAWYKLGNEVSERQWRDVAGVIRVQHPALDLEYLRNWAARLGLSPLLERALAEGQD